MAEGRRGKTSGFVTGILSVVWVLEPGDDFGIIK